jgi:hypothetical protein
VRRGVFTIHPRLVVKQVGRLAAQDGQQVAGIMTR